MSVSQWSAFGPRAIQSCPSFSHLVMPRWTRGLFNVALTDGGVGISERLWQPQFLEYQGQSGGTVKGSERRRTLVVGLSFAKVVESSAGERLRWYFLELSQSGWSGWL